MISACSSENPMTCAAEMRTVPAAFSLVETMTVPRVIGGCSVKGHHGVPDKDEIWNENLGTNIRGVLLFAVQLKDY